MHPSHLSAISLLSQSEGKICNQVCLTIACLMKKSLCRCSRSQLNKNGEFEMAEGKASLCTQMRGMIREIMYIVVTKMHARSRRMLLFEGKE